jgi:heat shock protein HslJ
MWRSYTKVFPKRLASVAATALAAVVLSQACSQTQSAEQAALPCAGEWRLQKMVSAGQEQPLVAGSTITLSCPEPGRLTGLASVNRYFGRFDMGTDGTIAWQAPGFARTKKAGPPALMEQEDIYLAALAATERMSLRAGRLVLESADQATVLEFTKLER